jgi:hypothetical protein
VKFAQFSLVGEDLMRRGEQIVDRCVTHRGDADALSGFDECVDDVRTAVRLARTRWALHRDVTLIELSHPLQRALEIIAEEPPRRTSAVDESRSFSGQQRHRNSTG